MESDAASQCFHISRLKALIATGYYNSDVNCIYVYVIKCGAAAWAPTAGPTAPPLPPVRRLQAGLQAMHRMGIAARVAAASDCVSAAPSLTPFI
jgi:hypothetical protein